MSHNEQIDELVHEILESDRPVEVVCATHPELLGDVRARLRALRAVEAQVDSLFPPSGVDTRTMDPSQGIAGDTGLPAIPDYEVQSILGRGGMGVVFKARHLKLNRHVALKMLLSGSYAGRQELLRFLREAESVAALRHPNVVQVYDIGEANGHPYYTMEYVAGGTLAERLCGDIQAPRDAAKMLGVLARAVQAAHESGIVHRDLKPANILMDDDGALKITDFGLARRLDVESALTHTGMRVGTPSYMAPEQMTGSSAALGPAVDVFALGAILYEMLTGHPPFRGATLSDTERRLVSEDAAPPSRSNPKVPRDLETICLKCIEKDPRARYASAGELADDLDRFLRHEPIHARPLPPAARWVRWVRRNPLLAALGATSIVLIGLIASQTMKELSESAASHAEKARLTTRFESGVELAQSGRYAEALAILGKLGDGGFADLRERIDRVLSQLDLVEKLDDIGVKRAMSLNAQDALWHPNSKACGDYAAAFAEAGMGKLSENRESFAAHIGASDIKQPLLATLDDWAVCETDAERRNQILEVARLAKPSEKDWYIQCRDPVKWNDPAALARLAETAHSVKPNVQQLRALGDRLAAAGLDATAFRRRVQEEHIDSFLANLSLADALREADPPEAIRYYQAALAIRPQSATAHNNLAVALANLGRPDEAIAQYKHALKLDPDAARIHFNLALELSTAQPDRAIQHLQKAIEINPELDIAQRKLAELTRQREAAVAVPPKTE